MSRKKAIPRAVRSNSLSQQPLNISRREAARLAGQRLRPWLIPAPRLLPPPQAVMPEHKYPHLPSLQTRPQLPAGTNSGPGAANPASPSLGGGIGARGEPLPPINQEQSPSAAKESSDLSPACLTWLLSPNIWQRRLRRSGWRKPAARRGASAGAGAGARNLLRVPAVGRGHGGTRGHEAPCQPGEGWRDLCHGWRWVRQKGRVARAEQGGRRGGIGTGSRER